MTKPQKISYVFIAVMFVLVAQLNMATPLLTALFAYFALCKLQFGAKKWASITLFCLLVLGIFYGFVFFMRQALVALPDIVSTSVPSIIEYAQRHGIPLPFTDPTLAPPEIENGTLDAQVQTTPGPVTATNDPSVPQHVDEKIQGASYAQQLKKLVLDNVKTQLRYLGNFAKIATKEFVFLAIGLVVAMSLFVNPRVDFDETYRLKQNLYTLSAEEIVARFTTFYRSFATVMGAQITISIINTTLTAVFILAISLPYSAVVIGVTFLCGLLPIIGNIISNSVIVGIAFTISPKLAIAALIFLISLHKLEYFLNSKIIGDRIKNPVWLTLLGLILGERLMGIPGMILAPVILHYIKTEASQVEVEKEPDILEPAGRLD